MYCEETGKGSMGGGVEQLQDAPLRWIGAGDGRPVPGNSTGSAESRSGRMVDRSTTHTQSEVPERGRSLSDTE